eukprot:9302840-Pyramimonas_sp.AAC.1
MWGDVAAQDRKCMRCIEAANANRLTEGRKNAKVCVECGKCQPREFFSGRMWANVADQDRKCMRCTERARVQRGCWKCVACKGVFPKIEFGRWLAKRATKKSNGLQRCNACGEDEECKEKEIAERNYAMAGKRQKVK